VTATHHFRLGGVPDQKPIDVTEAGQLDVLLNELQARFHDDPRLVSIASTAGEQSLSIALGADQSMLNWIDEGDTDNAYLTSRGNASATGDNVEFAFSNTWNEYPPRVLIPIDVARQAVRDFVATGMRPDNVTWVSSWRL
jgi:hypothetical protein